MFSTAEGEKWASVERLSEEGEGENGGDGEGQRRRVSWGMRAAYHFEKRPPACSGSRRKGGNRGAFDAGAGEGIT